MGRPSHVDKQAALDGALPVFWNQGYEATSLPDLLDAMQLTRGTFYRAFSDKRAVYLEALEYYGETRFNIALDLLRDMEHPPVQRLVNLFMRTETDAPGKISPQIGCFICNAMVEVAPFDDEVARLCNERSLQLQAALCDVLRDALPVSDDADIRRRGRILARMYFGAHAMGRMGRSFGDWDAFFADFLDL